MAIDRSGWSVNGSLQLHSRRGSVLPHRDAARARTRAAPGRWGPPPVAVVGQAGRRGHEQSVPWLRVQGRPVEERQIELRRRAETGDLLARQRRQCREAGLENNSGTNVTEVIGLKLTIVKSQAGSARITARGAGGESYTLEAALGRRMPGTKRGAERGSAHVKRAGRLLRCRACWCSIALKCHAIGKKIGNHENSQTVRPSFGHGTAAAGGSRRQAGRAGA